MIKKYIYATPVLLIGLYTAIAPFVYAGTKSLSDPGAVMKYRIQSSGRVYHSSSSGSSSDSSSSYVGGSKKSNASEDRLHRTNCIQRVASLVVSPVPEGGILPRGHAIAEIGRLDWDVESGTDGGSGPGAGFVGKYSIDPVDTIRLGGVFRIKNFFTGLNYAVSPDNSHKAQLIAGSIAHINPGKGAWWGMSLESGYVEGTATTKDFQGNIVDASVDTVWTVVTLERCHWSGIGFGLVYEELEIPTVLGLNDVERPVIAVFDDSVKWRSVSAVASYDSSISRLMLKKKGLSFDGAAQVGFGLGFMKTDEDGLRKIASDARYQFRQEDLMFAASADCRLGAAYTGQIFSFPAQLFIGYRYRASYRGNDQLEDDQIGNYYTVQTDAEIEVISHGPFVRFSAYW